MRDPAFDPDKVTIISLFDGKERTYSNLTAYSKLRAQKALERLGLLLNNADLVSDGETIRYSTVAWNNLIYLMYNPTDGIVTGWSTLATPEQVRDVASKMDGSSGYQEFDFWELHRLSKDKGDELGIFPYKWAEEVKSLASGDTISMDQPHKSEDVANWALMTSADVANWREVLRGRFVNLDSLDFDGRDREDEEPNVRHWTQRSGQEYMLSTFPTHIY